MTVHYDLLFSGGLDETWARGAACIDADPQIFFPDRGQTVVAAKEICAGCLVVEDCLNYALTWRINQGVWGGASVAERNKMTKPEALKISESPHGSRTRYAHGCHCVECTWINTNETQAYREKRNHE